MSQFTQVDASSESNNPRLRILVVAILGVLGLGLLLWMLITFWPIGVDWYYHFYPDTRLYLSGETLLFDDQTHGFYHPPWSIWLLIPFALLPLRVGQAMLWLATAVSLVATAVIFCTNPKTRPWAVAFALFNLHTFDHLYRGQMTFFDLPAIALGWLALKSRNPWLMAASLWLLTVNPPNTIPIAIFFLWASFNLWSIRNVVYILLPISITGLVSFAFFGIWPLRWIQNYAQNPTIGLAEGYLTTVWRIAEVAGVPRAFPILLTLLALAAGAVMWWRISRASTEITKEERLLDQLVLVLIFTFLVTPFSQSYRMIALVGVAAPFISSWRLWPAILLHLLTFTPLVRLLIGEYNGWVDYLYVAFMAGMFMLYVWDTYGRHLQEKTVNFVALE